MGSVGPFLTLCEFSATNHLVIHPGPSWRGISSFLSRAREKHHARSKQKDNIFPQAFHHVGLWECPNLENTYLIPRGGSSGSCVEFG